MNKVEQIKTRYSQGYITDSQLERYLELGVLTQVEYEEIYAIKHPVTEESVEEIIEEEVV